MGTANAEATGGDGGKGGAAANGGNGARGGTGGSAETDARGGLSSVGQAIGGKGGAGGAGGNNLVGRGGNGGDGRNGGDAIATASGSPLAAATATGGAGGAGGRAGTGRPAGVDGSRGNGGSGTATATAVGGLAAVATSSAQGGAGQRDGDATTTSTATARGVAVATATANAGPRLAPTGKATSTASASGGLAGLSSATSNGKGGRATATGIAVGGNRTVSNLVTQVDAPANGDTAVASRSQVGGSLPARAELDALQAGAFAVGDPQRNAVDAVAAGSPSAVAGLQLGSPFTHVLAWIGLGSLYPPTGDGSAADHSTSAALSVDLTTLDGQLRIGLLTPITSSVGVDQLSFDILGNGSPLLSVDFTNLLEAMAFFDDHVLEFGPIRALGSSSELDLDFLFTATGHDPGSGFSFDLVVASVENSAASVPAPDAWPLVTLGLLMMFIAQLRGRR